MNDYQKAVAEKVLTSSIYQSLTQEQRLELNALALCGEAGEFANIVKKLVWYQSTTLKLLRPQLEKELCDVFYHLVQLCTELGLSLDELKEKAFTTLQEKSGFDQVLQDGIDFGDFR